MLISTTMHNIFPKKTIRNSKTHNIFPNDSNECNNNKWYTYTVKQSYLSVFLTHLINFMQENVIYQLKQIILNG